MNEITISNLEKRAGYIKDKLGKLAYERRELEIKIERIDLQVTQMEAQDVILEATLNDLKQDESNEAGRLEAEKANAKQARSERAKVAAKKRKGKTPKATPRKG